MLLRVHSLLVDLEGGEFMHGNILDANSTNKLIDQSVKDAIEMCIRDSFCNILIKVNITNSVINIFLFSILFNI